MRMTRQQRGGKLRPGEVIAPHELVTIHRETVRVPDDNYVVHLQFRRFAGCPVCNLHLHSIIQRHDDIRAAGIREIVVFHSDADELLHHAAELPFAVIADPDKQLYIEFGAESSLRALLEPRAWLPIIRGISRSLVAIIRGNAPAPEANPRGGRLGLPADFLIDSAGRVLACKYGAHAYDQWSVDELLTLARPEEERRHLTVAQPSERMIA